MPYQKIPADDLEKQFVEPLKKVIVSLRRSIEQLKSAANSNEIAKEVLEQGVPLKSAIGAEKAVKTLLQFRMDVKNVVTGAVEQTLKNLERNEKKLESMRKKYHQEKGSKTRKDQK